MLGHNFQWHWAMPEQNLHWHNYFLYFPGGIHLTELAKVAVTDIGIDGHTASNAPDLGFAPGS